MTFEAWLDDRTLVTETTTGRRGSALRPAICWSEMTICAPASTGSIVVCGCPPWPPRPVTTMEKLSDDAMSGPGRNAKSPTGMPGMLCIPNTRSMPKRSMSPSSTISLPPPPPSSAGWKMTTAVPSKARVSARYCAAPSSIAVCPSWPQACIAPGVLDA